MTEDTGVTVLVYSHRAQVREDLIAAIGRRPARDLPKLTFVECAGVGEVLTLVDDGAVDLVVLDAEAQPTGGMGISRQLHNEAADPPPVVLAIRRSADSWLATWSKAAAVLEFPLDPVTAAQTVATVLRGSTLVGVGQP